MFQQTAHWSLALFLLMTCATGCGREEPVGGSNSSHEAGRNEARADVGPEALSLQADGNRSTTGGEPIYDVDADGAELIAAALKRARWEHKRVLVQWGDNTCVWCYKLHDLFSHNDRVHPILLEEYELVLIDGDANDALMKEYVGADGKYTFPHLTVLDADGNVLVNQNTELLEDGPQHDPAKVAAFLKKWTPEPIDAETLLADTLARAAEEDKRVFMRVGTPYCVWCGVLSRFLLAHELQLSGDYIDLKIDTRRMTHGGNVAERFQPGDSLGVPWMVILDSSGKVLATSVGPDGNCGYPYLPQEIDHFLGMLTSTRRQMTDEDLAVIRADLAAYRQEREETDRARRRGSAGGTSE